MELEGPEGGGVGRRSGWQLGLGEGARARVSACYVRAAVKQKGRRMGNKRSRSRRQRASLGPKGAGLYCTSRRFLARSSWVRHGPQGYGMLW